MYVLQVLVDERFIANAKVMSFLSNAHNLDTHLAFILYLLLLLL